MDFGIQQKLFSAKASEVMAYFALRFFRPEIGKYVIIGLNVILAIMGVTYWAIAGLYGNLVYYYNNQSTGITVPSLSTFYDGVKAFFAVAGIYQIAVGVLGVLLMLQVLGRENRLWWARAMIISLVFQFGFDFYIGVDCSMLTSLMNLQFKAYLTIDSKTIEALPDPNLKTFYRTAQSLVQLVTAQAIITWIVVIPAVCLLIIGLIDQLLNENTINDMGKLIAVPATGQVPPRSMAVVQPMDDSIVQPKTIGTMGNLTQPTHVQPAYK